MDRLPASLAHKSIHSQSVLKRPTDWTSAEQNARADYIQNNLPYDYGSPCCSSIESDSLSISISGVSVQKGAHVGSATHRST